MNDEETRNQDQVLHSSLQVTIQVQEEEEPAKKTKGFSVERQGNQEKGLPWKPTTGTRPQGSHPPTPMQTFQLKTYLRQIRSAWWE